MAADVKKWLEAHQSQAVTGLVLLGLAGMLLIAFSGFWPQGEKAAPTQSGAAEPDAYVRQLEQRLTAMIEAVDGAGETAVMITLEGTGQTVYAHDMQTSESGSQQTHIILETSQGEQALTETVYQPAVLGVAVVCEGAGDITVKAQVTEMVSVLLGVSTNRISITRMSA